MKPHHLASATSSQVSFAVLLLIVVCLSARGQSWTQYDQGTPPQHAAGVSPVGSYLSSDLGTVNLSNGSLNLALPLGTAGGRGFTIPIALNYSSKIWSIAYDSAYWPPPHDMDVEMAYASYAAGDSYEDIYFRVAPGWTIGGLPLLKRQTVGITPCPGGYGSNYILEKLTVVLPDKGEIELRDDQTDGAPFLTNCTTAEYRGARWHATDGSGAIFISDVDNGIVNSNLNGTLITADGMRYKFATISGLLARVSVITDRNGNQILINHSTGTYGQSTTEFIDQLGRSTKIEQNVPDPANTTITLPLLVTLNGYQGTPQYYKVKTEALSQHIRSDFNYNGLPIKTGNNDRLGYCYQGGQPPAANYLFTGSYCGYQERIDTQAEVSQIILPDGRSLQFSYNLYGELAEVVLPTGGKLQYDYTGFNYSGFPSGNTLPGEYQGQLNTVQNIDRAVTERRTYPDGTTLEQTSVYLFGPQTVNGSSSACTEVKAYAGTATNGTLLSDQRHFFLPSARYLSGSHGSMSGTGYSLWSTGVEWRTETLDAAGSVMNASEQDWAQRTPVSWSSGYAQEQPANDNRVSEGRRYLDTGSFAKTDTFYDNDPTHYPRVNNVSEVKEYDFDQSLKRRTTNSYVTGAYQTDDAIHLLSLVQQQSVYDGTGTNEVARTVNEYDVYGDSNHAPLQDYGAVTGHDSAYGLSKFTRGNVTGTGRWLKSNNTTLYSYLSYDTLGNPVSNKDPKGNVTSLSYQDDFGNGSNPGTMTGGNYGATYSVPTLITSPPPTPGAPVHTARTQYDFWSGLLTGFKDRNGVITQTIYNDPFSRPTLVKQALGVSGLEAHAAMYYAPTTAFGITLANNDVLTAKDQTTLDDATLRSWTHTDGFGRTVETWSRDPQGDDKVSTVYDALGRVQQQSNPFRPSLGESAIYSTTAYDFASRVTTVTTPDSATVNSYYSGNQVLVKDQAAKERMSQTNALGQLTDVWEILSTAEASNDDAKEAITFPNHSEVAWAYRTKYAYDTLGNLKNVTQQKGTAGTIQTRMFVYNSLSQLTDATNPESGTVSYQYDNNGNLTQKVDPRLLADNVTHVTTTYDYDALNRIKTRSYNDGTSPNYLDRTPTVIYTYDGPTNGKGRLWKTESSGSNGSRTTVDGYDAFGRPVTESQQFFTNNNWSVPFTVSAIYNLAGAILSETYPSVHAITDTYSTAGRLSTFTGTLGDGATRTYATGLTYSTFGGLKQEQFGVANLPLYHRLRYNVRGQLYDVRVSSVQADELNWNRGCLAFYYGGAAWGESGPANNGNLTTQQHFAPGDEAISSYSMMQQNYAYDSLNRLAWMGEYANGQTLVDAQSYSFDRYGNKTTSASWNLPYKQFTVDAGTNRLLVPSGQSGTMTYDNAGNLTTDTYSGSAVSRVYDAENRMKSETQAGSVVAGSYVYDGDGRRVKRTVAGQPSAVETWQVYGFSGELLAEYAANTSPASPQKEYGYRNGELLVTADISLALPAPVFSDDFNSASLDATKWSVTDANRVSDNGQQLQVSLLANTAGYYAAYSNSTYDLTGKTVQVEVAQPISQAGWCENFVQVVLDGNNYFLIDAGAGSMIFRSTVNGVNDQTYLPVFEPAVEHYWRIRHDQGANTINFETSADNSTWTLRKSAAVGFSLTSMRFYLYAGAWGTGNGAPGAAKYDNVKLQGNTPTTVANLHWLVTDQLGTPRIILDQTGTLANVSRHDYLPFGEELFAGTGGRTTAQGYPTGPNASDGVRQKFTRKERDNETGLDYFGARYYASTQGRFTSPDAFWKDSNVFDPQSWNKYGYVRNNPLQYIDPKGEKADVAIQTDEEHKTGTITIKASIAIYAANGSKLSQNDLNRAKSTIKQAIEGAWSGTYKQNGITYTVTTQVDVQVQGSEKDAINSGAQNAIGLTNGAVGGGADSVVQPGSFSGAPDTGTWNIKTLSSGGAAHEFTHLLGVDDRSSGPYLSNTNILNDSSVPWHATAYDFGWAFGGAINSHRSESRQYKGDAGSTETRSSPMFRLGAPESHRSTTELRAGRIWWN